MKKSNTSSNISAIIILFFILSSIINLLKIDDRNSIPINFKNNTTQPRTELVVSNACHKFFYSFKQILPEKNTIKIYSGLVDRLHINRFKLSYFDDLISNLINSNMQSFASIKRIINSIHMRSIPRQSQDEYSSIIS